jgi:hypothetical protein
MLNGIYPLDLFTPDGRHCSLLAPGYEHLQCASFASNNGQMTGDSDAVSSPSQNTISRMATPLTPAAQDHPKEPAGIVEKVKERVVPRDPLDPPPPSFTRPPPVDLPYTPFTYMTLYSKGLNPDDGFPLTVPGCCGGEPNQRHPFISHDVQKADWQRYVCWNCEPSRHPAHLENLDYRFLEDIAIIGKLSMSEQVQSRAVPHISGLAGPAGFFTSRGIRRKMARRNAGPVGELVDVWNDVCLSITFVRVSRSADIPAVVFLPPS